MKANRYRRHWLGVLGTKLVAVVKSGLHMIYLHKSAQSVGRSLTLKTQGILVAMDTSIETSECKERNLVLP